MVFLLYYDQKDLSPMVIKLDKNHRVKKTKLGWLPQWKRGWFIWRNYRLCTADTQMGNLIEFSEQKTPPVFDTSDHALDFIKKAIAGGYKGSFYQDFDTYLPGLKDWWEWYTA